MFIIKSWHYEIVNVANITFTNNLEDRSQTKCKWSIMIQWRTSLVESHRELFLA